MSFIFPSVSSLVMSIVWNWGTWSSTACPKAKATKSVQKKSTKRTRVMNCDFCLFSLCFGWEMRDISMVLQLWSPNPGVSPDHLLEIQVLWPHLRLPETQDGQPVLINPSGNSDDVHWSLRTTVLDILGYLSLFLTSLFKKKKKNKTEISMGLQGKGH